MSIDDDARLAADRKDGPGRSIILGLQFDDRRLALGDWIANTLSLDGTSIRFEPPILTGTASNWNLEEFMEWRRSGMAHFANSV